MPYEQVRCRRTINSAPEDVWACLRGFDLNWHPFVASCSLKPGPDGAVWRDFTTSDGGHLVEQRTYISDADRVLCYTARSGIDGVISYHARIAVIHEGGHSCVTWQADIVAARARLDAIAQGTRVIFEAGLDSLANGLPPLPPHKPPKPLRVAVRRGAIDGTPRLSYLTGDVAHPKGGTLVLCVHGIGGQASNWVEQIEAFGADYTIAAMDLRGYGQSTLGFSPTQIDDYCDDICAMADHFGAKRLVLVGLSLGSWIATSFAMRHRDKLAGLVLAGGCTGMSEADPQVRQSFRDAREAPLSQGQTPADFADAVVQMIAGPNANDDLRARLHDSMSAICVETYRDALNCFCNPLETFDFANITCPVLMMTGADDRLAPPDEIRGVSVRIFEDVTAVSGHADVRFEVLADAGHLCNIEQPEAFNHHLGAFVQRLPEVSVRYKPSRAEKQRQKRHRILQAAHTEFCNMGFEGASMDRLAKVADVSKPTLYQYFGDKEGLFTAVLEEGRAHIIAPLVGRDGTLVDRLWRFSWTYANFVLRPDMLSLARLILGEAGRRPKSAIKYHQNGPGQAFGGLVDFVRTAQDAGELLTDDAALAAHDLWSLILSGPRDHYLHYVDDRPSDAELLRVIGHGLRVFLKAYSCNLAEDETRLILLIQNKKKQVMA